MRRASSTLLVVAFALFVGACTAEVEDAGAPPDVDVTGGEMPNVDVQPADVDVSTDTQTVEVPDVDVETSQP